MLPIPQYLGKFTLYFLQHCAQSPYNFSKLLAEAKELRSLDIQPAHAAAFIIQNIAIDKRFLGTLEGQNLLKDIDQDERRRRENIALIRTWHHYELCQLIWHNVDISQQSRKWLVQWREDLDLMV